MNGVIVGIDNRKGQRIYRIILFRYVEGKWQFKRQMAPEGQLASLVGQGKVKLLNAESDGRTIRGTTGSLDRFNGKHKPLVIISELVVKGQGTIGYKVANYEGVVKNIAEKDLVEYCRKVSNAGEVPIQNGQYVQESGGRQSFIRAYPGGEYIKEVVVRRRSKHVKPANVDQQRNEKAISRIEELFTPEQIKQLKLGKMNGVDIKVYGNNKLSAEQMEVIRKGLEDGINAKLYADPAYSVDAMRILRADMKYGVDVSYYLNPEYSAEQLSELANGFISGVDVSVYADPKIPPQEMAEIRMRLENGIWREMDVENDTSWK